MLASWAGITASALRHVEDDVAVAVQAAGRVGIELAASPVVAVPGLPDEGRVVRVDADALDVRLEPEPHRVRGHGLGETHVECVAGLGRLLEAVEAGALLERRPVVTVRLAIDHRAELGELARDDRQLLGRGEDDRLLGLGPDRRDLRAGGDADGVGLGRREPERDLRPRRRRREEAHADELEELDVVALGHAVEPVEQLVGHPREGLDERDAGVGDVVVGPLGAALLDEALGIVHEVLEAAIVEVRRLQRHLNPPRG
jgi:hypothetical protein